jgi:hypothetical protein
MLLVRPTPRKPFSTFTTSLATFLNRSKELISFLPPTRTISTRSSSLIGLRASLPTSLGEFSSRSILQLVVDGCTILTEIKRYPPNTDEKGKALGNFFQTTGAPPKTAAKVPATLKEIEAKYSSIKTWGVVGVSFPPFLSPSFLLTQKVLLGRQNRIYHHLQIRYSVQSWR